MNNVVTDEIYQKPSGTLFSAMDFLDIAQRNTIDQTLLRLTMSGSILKVATGLFYIPKKHHIIGDLPPSIEEMVTAYAHKFDYQIQVSPAKAANLLGLSSHVPAKHTYLTDGKSRTVVLGGNRITFKHVTPKKLLGINTKAGLILQALYYFGKNGLTRRIVIKIKSQLENEDKKQLREWLHLMPQWMHDIVAQDILNV